MEEQVLKSKKIAELKQVAAAFGISGSEKMKKAEIIDALLALRETQTTEPVTVVRRAAADKPAKAAAQTERNADE